MPLFYETFFPAWFLFYILGMDCKSGRMDRFVSNSNVFWILVALGLSFCESLLLIKSGCNMSFAASQIKISSFLYAFSIVMVFVKNEKIIEQNLLTVLGDNSYGIFYVHLLVMMFARKILTSIGISNIWIIYFLLCFIVTIVVSCLIVAAVKYGAEKVKRKELLKLIGF